MHPDLTWTDFKMFNRNKFWCSGISCFVLLKKRDDVCWGRSGKNSNIVIIIHKFLQMWIMFAIIFITLFSSAPQVAWPRALIGVLWLSSWDSCVYICCSPLLQNAVYEGGQDWSAHTCGFCSGFKTLPLFF